MQKNLQIKMTDKNYKTNILLLTIHDVYRNNK